MAEPRAITLTRDLMMSLMMPSQRERLRQQRALHGTGRVLEYPSSVLRKTGRRRPCTSTPSREPAERQRPTTAVVVSLYTIFGCHSDCPGGRCQPVRAWCTGHPSATDHPSLFLLFLFFLFLSSANASVAGLYRALVPPASSRSSRASRRRASPKSPAGSREPPHTKTARGDVSSCTECHPARRQRTTPDAIGARAAGPLATHRRGRGACWGLGKTRSGRDGRW